MIDFQKLWLEIEQIDGRKLSAKKIYEIMKELDEPVKETGRRSGRWLRNANKFQQNVRRWKIYKTDKYVGEDEVTEWKGIE